MFPVTSVWVPLHTVYLSNNMEQGPCCWVVNKFPAFYETRRFIPG